MLRLVSYRTNYRQDQYYWNLSAISLVSNKALVIKCKNIKCSLELTYTKVEQYLESSNTFLPVINAEHSKEPKSKHQTNAKFFIIKNLSINHKSLRHIVRPIVQKNNRIVNVLLKTRHFSHTLWNSDSYSRVLVPGTHEIHFTDQS